MTEETDGSAAANPRAVAMSLAGILCHIGNGELAALRRIDEEAATPIYWRLAARHDVLAARRAAWVPIVRALAVLTAKGPPGDRGELHDARRRFGALLCDGGTSGWPGSLAPGRSPRPALSERRLAQLLAARGPQRATLLTRAVRAVAARRDSALGVDVGDLAWVFLDAGGPEAIAQPYYQRLDRAARALEQPETESSDH